MVNSSKVFLLLFYKSIYELLSYKSIPFYLMTDLIKGVTYRSATGLNCIIRKNHPDKKKRRFLYYSSRRSASFSWISFRADLWRAYCYMHKQKDNGITVAHLNFLFCCLKNTLEPIKVLFCFLDFHLFPTHSLMTGSSSWFRMIFCSFILAESRISIIAVHMKL